MSRRREIQGAIQDVLKAATVRGQTTPFFKTVNRGKITALAERPAALILSLDWKDAMRGSIDAVRQTFTLVIAVLVDNADGNEDSASDAMEEGIAIVQAAMEADRRIRDLVIRVTPLGGSDTGLEEAMPILGSTLLYEVEYERPRGQP